MRDARSGCWSLSLLISIGRKYAGGGENDFYKDDLFHFNFGLNGQPSNKEGRKIEISNHAAKKANRI